MSLQYLVWTISEEWWPIFIHLFTFSFKGTCYIYSIITKVKWTEKKISMKETVREWRIYYSCEDLLNCSWQDMCYSPWPLCSCWLTARLWSIPNRCLCVVLSSAQRRMLSDVFFRRLLTAEQKYMYTSEHFYHTYLNS